MTTNKSPEVHEEGKEEEERERRKKDFFLKKCFEICGDSHMKHTYICITFFCCFHFFFLFVFSSVYFSSIFFFLWCTRDCIFVFVSFVN